MAQNKSDEEHILRTVLLDTDDLGVAEEVLSANYQQMRFTAPPDSSTSTKVTRWTLGSLTIDEQRYGYQLNFETEPTPALLLSRVHSGRITQYSCDGTTERTNPGMVSLLGARDGLPFSGVVDQVHHNVIVMERYILSSVATPAPSRRDNDPPVEMLAGVPVSPAANAHLVRVVDHICRDVLADPYALDSPLIAGNLARYLAASILATFPHTALLDPSIEDRHDSTPLLLRRAVAFIDENAHLDISLTDIARHIYITPRALQYMFRKHLDCTPMEYMRRVRLHHAHQELVDGHPLTTGVGTIARKWGFSNVGRFAVAYRQAYGQSPHVTLRS